MASHHRGSVYYLQSAKTHCNLQPRCCKKPVIAGNPLF